MWLALLVLLATAEQPSHGESGIAIEGGADPTGQVYTWTVHNVGRQHVDHIEFPHYRASLFFAPPGWSHSCTNLVGIGVKNQSGTCSTRAQTPLAPGRSAEFRMQIAASGARRSAGTVVIHFDDGHVESIPAEVPGAEPAGDKYISLIGLGVIFAAALLVRWARSRRTPKAPPPGA